MPHVNFWIRKEDYDKWLAIKDKPLFIHAVLNNTQDITAVKKTAKPQQKMIESLLQKTNEIDYADKPTLKCGHFADSRGKCLMKGCTGK